MKSLDIESPLMLHSCPSVGYSDTSSDYLTRVSVDPEYFDASA